MVDVDVEASTAGRAPTFARLRVDALELVYPRRADSVMDLFGRSLRRRRVGRTVERALIGMGGPAFSCPGSRRRLYAAPATPSWTPIARWARLRFFRSSTGTGARGEWATQFEAIEGCQGVFVAGMGSERTPRRTTTNTTSGRTWCPGGANGLVWAYRQGSTRPTRRPSFKTSTGTTSTGWKKRPRRRSRSSQSELPNRRQSTGGREWSTLMLARRRRVSVLQSPARTVKRGLRPVLDLHEPSTAAGDVVRPVLLDLGGRRRSSYPDHAGRLYAAQSATPMNIRKIGGTIDESGGGLASASATAVGGTELGERRRRSSFAEGGQWNVRREHSLDTLAELASSDQREIRILDVFSPDRAALGLPSESCSPRPA